MRLATLTLSLCFAALCLATGLPGQKEKEERRPELTKKELAERLETAKKEVFERMFSRKMLLEPRLGRKWLAKFQVVQSEHYLLYTNGPRNTVKKFAVSLEDLYDYVQEQFPFEDIDERLECFIFKTKEEYVDFCVKIAGWQEKQAQNTAGHANAKYYATYYQSPTADTVMHEATHQIVGACLKIVGVGSWFQEGMAVYIERKIGNTKPDTGMKSDLRSGNYIPLKVFCGLQSLLFSAKPGEGERNYRHAGALIDFLVNTEIEPVAGRFPEFLAGAKKTGRSIRASRALVEKVYGVTLEELEELWKQHYKIR